MRVRCASGSSARLIGCARSWRREHAVTPARPRGGKRFERRRVIGALAVVLVAFLTLSPPGRALAESLAEIVGIGESPTLDYSKVSGIEPDGPALVVGSGVVPGTEQPYEWVGFAGHSKVPSIDAREAGQGREFSCLALDLTMIERPSEPRGTACITGEPRGALYVNGFGDDPDQSLGPDFRFTLSGTTNADVDSIEVRFVDVAGRAATAPVLFGKLEGEIAAELEAPTEFGLFVAYLPDQGTLTDLPGPAMPGYMESVEVRALDASGNVLAVDDARDLIALRERGGRRLERLPGRG